VGVHLRQGDYRTWLAGRNFFPTPCYVQWMHELAEQFPERKVAFLVCSDEPRDAREFSGLQVGWGPGSPVGDLYALAKCDYILGPVSSFSQWASFYGNKPLRHVRDRGERVDCDSFRVSFLREIP